jgi:hypothetical protein
MAATSSGRIATFTLFRFSTFSDKYWAFKMMILAPRSFKKVSGLEFFKVLGSGAGNGFALKPNFSVYAFLAIWSDEQTAKNFFENHPLFNEYCSRSSEQFTFYLRPLSAYGKWEGKTLFEADQKPKADQQIAVLTRARLRKRKLPAFWKHVHSVSVKATDNPDCLLSIGVGERPLFELTTFSIWKDTESMEQFAYKKGKHSAAIRKARQDQWFEEDLFARFTLCKTEGKWKGLSIS